MPYVYSTATQDTCYAVYAKNDSKDLPVIERQILIRGGANLANKYIETPKGVMTEVTEEELALLENDYHFNKARENGFITVENEKIDIEKAISDLEEKDASAPLTPADEIFNREEGTKVAEDSKGKEGKKGNKGNKKKLES